MMLLTIWRTFITLFAAIVYAQAQTRTAVDPNSGNTVVEVITTTLDPNLGVVATTTRIISTIGQQQPPAYDPVVGAPQATQSSVQTLYWVTTTIAGVSTVRMYTFTPTFSPSSAPQQYSQGSIINYQEWTSQYATRTVAPPTGGARLAAISLCTLIALVAGATLALV